MFWFIRDDLEVLPNESRDLNLPSMQSMIQTAFASLNQDKNALTQRYNIFAALFLEASKQVIDLFFQMECTRDLLDQVLLSPVLQDLILYRTLKSGLSARFPGSLEYRIQFCSDLIRRAEKLKVEVHDELLRTLSQLKELKRSRSSESKQDLTPVSYQIFNVQDKSIILRSNPQSELGNVIGLKCWPAAFYLTEYLLAHPDLVEQKKCLELGSGCGFTGITTSALLNPESLVLSDYQDSVVSNLKHNISINRVDRTRCLKVDWNERLPSKIHVDFVFGADLIYSPDLIQPLVETLLDYLGTASKALIANVQRNPETWDLFLKTLCSHQLNVDTISFRIESALFHIDYSNIQLVEITNRISS